MMKMIMIMMMIRLMVRKSLKQLGVMKLNLFTLLFQRFAPPTPPPPVHFDEIMSVLYCPSS